jgi:hypothetical protein
MMSPRRYFAVAMALLAIVAGGWVDAAEASIEASQVIANQGDKAVGRGLAWLASQQKKDGSFTDQGPRIAITSLGLLSFLSAGETPGAGKYGSVVRSSIDYLVQQAPPDGYFGKLDGSRMYGHAIATLALAEAWGVEQTDSRRARIRDVLKNAGKVIVEAQRVNKPAEFDGGWRYEPQAADSDLSLSGWNLLALQACQQDGLEIPGDSVSQAMAFIVKCHRKEGGFGYQPGGEITAGSTGVAVLCLYLWNTGGSEVRADGLKYLKEHPVDDQTRFPYYAMYYIVHAAVQSEDDTIRSSSNQALERLIKMQLPDGSWPQSKSGEEPGVFYATPMAILTLEAPYRLLPVYQQ